MIRMRATQLPRVDGALGAVGRFILAFLCAICLSFCSPAASTAAFAEDSNASPSTSTTASSPTLVKVGYVNLQGFLELDDNGNYTGLAYDLLQEIAVYNNWTYRFVEIGYMDAPGMLENGEIDLFVPYQKTPERQELLEYGDMVFCTNKASLLTLPTSDIYYQDYDHMNDITLGCVEGTRNGDRFTEDIESHGGSVKEVLLFHDQKELLKALDEGKVDAAISASNRGIEDSKILDILPATNSYVVGKKGDPTYVTAVDKALVQINLNMPDLLSTLNLKYQVPDGGTYPSFTREEAEYMAQKGAVTVLASAAECDEQGNFVASAKVLFDELERMTGMSFDARPMSSPEELEVFGNGDVDTMYNFTDDSSWAEEHNAWLTQTYCDFNAQFVTQYDTSEVTTVAALDGSYYEEYARDVLGYEIVSCPTYKEGLELVKKGSVDALVCNGPIGSYYASFPQYQQLSFRSAYNLKRGYCLAVSKSCDPMLVSIVDKCVNSMKPSLLTEAYDTQMRSHKTSLTDLIYTNPVEVSIGAIFTVFIIMLLLFSLFRAKSIRQKNEQLEIANNAKSEFLSRMSHDMRTPLNGILGLAELAQRKDDPAAVKKDLAQIRLSGSLLLNLINDTLDMNRIEAGKMELKLKPADPHDLAHNVLSNARILAEEKGIVLDEQAPSPDDNVFYSHYLMVDASRVEQLLMNIVSNAIKFTPPGNTVYLIQKTIDSNAEGLVERFIVRDTGCGISEEYLPDIFVPFSQEGRENTKREEGTGLGMSIVKNIVDMMGGTIGITSVVGKGTTVTIDLPFSFTEQEPENAKVVPENVERVLDGARVLLCEDNEVNSSIAMQMLSSRKVAVERAEDGREGVDMFEASPAGYFDAVLMDIRMPRMNGLEASRAIRALDRPDAQRVPIVALSANAFEEDIRECKEAGMTSHVSKPIDSKRLYTVLAEEIAASRA